MQPTIDAINRIPMIETLLEVICRTTGMGFAVIARVTQQQWIACAVRDEISFGLKPGGELELETTLCHEVNHSKEAIIIDHVAEDEVYAYHHTPAIYGFQSYISVPITLRNGIFFGTLCAIDPEPASLKNPETIGMFKLYAELIAFHLSTDEQMNAIEQVLKEERIAAHEQMSLSEELAATNEELISTNDELAALNEELAASNEELSATNEELSDTKHRLQEQVLEVELSRARFRNMINSSPVAMLVHRGDDLIFEEINVAMLQIIGKDYSVKGKSWFEAIPELVGQPIIDILYHTYHTGEESKLIEAPVTINKNGVPYQGYYNVTYTAIAEDGIITGVMQSAVDVTEQVNSRKKLEQAELSLRMAVEAAELGTFSIDVIDRTFASSPRLKEFFGFRPDEELPYDAALGQIHPDYRKTVADLVEAVITTGTKYDTEYPIIGHHDGKVRWVRGVGTVQQDADGVNRYFTGVLHEITEQKIDEIRKNDFIGMVSHELKTPLTSLNAHVQVLQSRAIKRGDEFEIGGFAKIKSQVNKMTVLINGFLNVSRLDAGKIHLDLQTFNLDDLLQDVMEDTKLIAPSYNIVILPCKPVGVIADRDKIGQVLSNFLSNAIKYSPKGRTIILACERIGDTVQISVQDEGMGVKPESVNKLFERYYRVETKHTQHISGFGIGLYLCAEIIGRHKGKIWAESEIGIGSTFYFTIPLDGSALHE